MLGLPQRTELNRQLPKKSIYAKFGLKASQQEKFDADISRITIVSEVSTSTTSIAAGAEVSGFYVVNVTLKRKKFEQSNIVMLSKLIDQKMLFVLQYEEEVMLAVYNTKLLCSEWMPSDSATISLTGLTLDTVWNNVVISIGGLTIEGDNSIKEQIEQDTNKAKLLKKIEQLERKARAEKQPRRKMELVEEIKKYKKELYV